MTSDEAYENYQELSSKMAKSFPEDDFKTYKRTSFTEQQLEIYLSQHFQRLDLLSFIENRPAFVINAYSHSGNWFQAIGFYKESIASYNDFFHYYEIHQDKLSADEIDGYVGVISYARGILAENYAKIKNVDSAAIQHIKNISFNDSFSSISYPSAINNYGLFFYRTKKDRDSALIYFEKAYKITEQQFPGHSLVASIRDNIADVYTDQNRYAEAKTLYATNFEFYKTGIIEATKTKDIQRLISAGTQLVHLNIKLKNLVQAQYILFQVDSIVEDAKTRKELLADSQIEFLSAKENLYVAQNHMTLAYKILSDRFSFSDSLATIAALQDSQWRDELNHISVDRVALKFEIDRIEKENKIKSQRAKLWISTLISSGFIVLLLVLFLGRRQHIINAKNKELLAEQQLENERLKVEQLNSKIQSKQRDLSDFALNLTQNQEWALMLSEKIKLLKTADQKDRRELLEILELDIKNKVQFDRDSNVFYERLDKLNDAFYTTLLRLFPNLTKNEIRLCSLIRLKMESHSIATFQNITNASLNTSRYRMRKKMHLGDEVNLDDFILQL